ncbi:MAG: DNA topoisomerase, partial [Oscillospiraceae bacterium]|nr:DNA topoisomerase [Oscillospiraceae bacterium]
GASSGGAAGLGAGAGGAAGASAAANAFRLTWVDGKSGVARCFDKAKIDGILAELESPKVKKEGVVTDITKSIKKKNPPKLYDLTELQRDANKRYGYSPKDTLSIMQSLYEEHKLLTYPRTDSRYISTDIIPTIPERLKACSDKPYAKMCAHILRSPIRPNSNYVDNAKVSDHHAIIPTEQPLSLILLSERERKIYDLVVTRFLSVFYPPFEYEQTKVTLKIGNETFTANGKVVISQGYKGVYQGADSDDEDEDDDGGWGGGFGGGSGSGGSFGGGFGGGGNSSGGSSGGGSGWSGSSGGVGGGVSSGAQTLPKLKKGDRLPIQSIKITEGTTSPPAPFNEATLLSAMESPAKYMTTQDTSLARTLEQTGGLGTVATRADIIEKLFDSFLIEKKGKDIFSTSKGRQLLNLVPKDLKSPELTGEWEQKLLSISKGNLNKSIFLSGIRSYTAEIIREIKNSTETYRHDNLTTNKCPNCGKFMLQVKGKKGDMLVCQDRECNARVNISISIRSKCPNCNKFMKITGEGDGRRVVCTCGYREKYSSFEKRKKEERNSLSKREVQDYIEKLNKRDEKGKKDDKDNPFAALKDLKF